MSILVARRGTVASTRRRGAVNTRVVSNTAEGGTNGTTVTTGNSGGTSGTALSAATIGTGATFAFDNTHSRGTGSLTYKLATSATSAVVNGAWTVAPVGTLWTRLYLYAPIGATLVFMEVLGAAGALRAALQVGSSGALSLVDSGGSIRGTTTALVPSNQWVRIEAKIVGSSTAPALEAKLFNSPEATTPTETLVGSSVAMSAADLQQVMVGTSLSFASTGPYWVDDIAVDTANYPGPSGTSGGAEGIPTQVAGYWWSNVESPTVLTPSTGNPDPGAEWSAWGQGDTNTYGVPAIVSASAEGIAAPPSGDHVIKLRHSGVGSSFGSDYPPGDGTTYGHGMHKLYKSFTANNWPVGTEPDDREGAPADVSGRYITYLYYRSDQMEFQAGFWSVNVAFKEDYIDTNSNFVSDPSYWLGFNSFDPANPLFGLTNWMANHNGPQISLTQFYDKWTKFEMRVYQGDRLEVYINDSLFDTAYNSEYAVGRGDFVGQVGSSGTVVSQSKGWTFLSGNYTNGGDVPTAASGIYVDLSCLLPLPA